jgi:hypothetical protein
MRYCGRCKRNTEHYIFNGRMACNPVLRDVIDQVWPLATAPFSADVKHAVQATTNFGNDRWF